MKSKIDSTRVKFVEELAEANSSADLEQLRVRYLGRKGPVQDLMKNLKEVAKEERPSAGKWINDLKVEITRHLEEKSETILLSEETERLYEETLDVTLPGRRREAGRKHVLNQTLDEIIEILVEMGFSVQHGPDMESEYYNFEALNFAPDHPARDMQDTFYLTDNMLLRTHTSNVQARVMEQTNPPIRIIAPGKVYRNEAISARSHVFFQQVEAFYVDKGVTFADLISTMDLFLKKLFNQEVKVRFRPSYFPFVEPGMEVDIHCLSCKGSGCAICKHTGWLEVAGAGMVHPEVLKNGNIDPEEYSGYAWGLGVERLAMLKHGIKDIRLFSENDTRFLKQFTAV